MTRSLRAFLCLLLATATARASEPADTELFESRVRPILVEHCVKCHGDKKQKGGLRLDTRAGWQKGGETGPAIIPKRSKDSLLIRMVAGAPGKPPEMPPDYRLPPEQTAELVRWIDAGAPDPRTAESAAQAAKPIDWKAAAEFWSFRPIVAHAPPAVDAPTPIDRFILAKLREQNLTPAVQADRRTLIRRATFDLTGLPPTLAEVAAFEGDQSPDAFAHVVDRLLASPRYGEHQARAWLDLARFGEDQSDSDSKDFALPHAWRYRDWVIEAFNKDVPYDRFVKLQIAADLMEDEGTEPADRRALGFIGLGAIYARPNDLDRKRAEEWDDRLDTLTRTFLGLTVACARCHDHKFDPIPAQDYYSLAGVIASTKNVAIPIAPRAEVAAYDAAKAKAAGVDQAAKDLLQQEADRVATQKVELLPKYALAAWTYRAKLLDEPKLKPEDFAKANDLDPTAFRKIDAYLRGGGGRGPTLERWSALLPTQAGATKPPPAVRELADLFATLVTENLAKPYKKRNLDMQGDLFGPEKGAFPLNEKTLLPTASAGIKSQYAKLADAAKSAAAALPPPPALCNGVVDSDKPADLRVYLRGNPSKQGDKAPRRFLRALAGPDAPPFTRGSGRLELAQAIANPQNPLTARVIVNRIWQQHFGRGLVATPSDFGTRGERPTHPELLDYLADQFVRQGWSIKRLHREMLLTQVYQRGSTTQDSALPGLSSVEGGTQHSSDPENRWLWKFTRRRLTVESFRDATLAVAGNLDVTPYGPSGDVDDVAFVRRTVYGKVSRHDLAKLLKLFDFPAPNISADRRTDTTLPQQALFLLNSPLMASQAKILAARFTTNSTDPATQIRTAYQLALAREPTPAELELATRYLSAPDAPASKPKDATAPTRTERFALALLASNEFFYID